MTDSELLDLLDDIESDRSERKESASVGDRIRQAVCAFANDLPGHGKPGVVFIGADDRGNPVGLEVTDQLLQNLASMRQDGNILPFPSLDVQKRRLKGGDLAVMIVHPSVAPPVRFKGIVWIRSGSRRVIANPDDERRLNERRRYRDVPVDIRPVEGAGLDSIDELLFRRTYLPSAVSPEVIDQNQRTLEHQLLASRFAHAGTPTCPTVLGILSVGKSPTDWVPGAFVQLIRFDGMSSSDPIIDATEFRGPLPDLLTQTENALKLNIRSTVDLTSADREIRTPDYPIEALQQILRNAILHRTYENTHAPVNIYWFSDRVEIQNPGGPFGQVTRENFGQPGVCDYRNPNLAGVMKDLGYVQHFGVGIQTARKAMARLGNPDPEFQVESSHLAVILRRRA